MGIDYGMGLQNVDHKTGIRYGVISQNEVLQVWADSSEPFYGEAICPDCGKELVEYDKEKHCDFFLPEKGCADYTCENCKTVMDSADCLSEEPLSYVLDDGQYLAESDSHGDIFIMKSPYFTFCQFCSPCAPGAGYLLDRGADCRAYCFGHDFFENGKAPYLVYFVETGEEV